MSDETFWDAIKRMGGELREGVSDEVSEELTERDCPICAQPSGEPHRATCGPTFRDARGHLQALELHAAYEIARAAAYEGANG